MSLTQILAEKTVFVQALSIFPAHNAKNTRLIYSLFEYNTRLFATMQYFFRKLPEFLKTRIQNPCLRRGQPAGRASFGGQANSKIPQSSITNHQSPIFNSQSLPVFLLKFGFHALYVTEYSGCPLLYQPFPAYL